MRELTEMIDVIPIVMPKQRQKRSQFVGAQRVNRHPGIIQEPCVSALFLPRRASRFLDRRCRSRRHKS
jgi:hypothetical protein